MLSSQQEFKGTCFALLFAIMKHIKTCRTSRPCVLSIKCLSDVEKPIEFVPAFFLLQAIFQSHDVNKSG